MSGKGVAHKPSKTAAVAAMYRVISNKDFQGGKLGPDYLAEYFLPPVLKALMKSNLMRKMIKKRTDSIMPGMNEYMTARTVFFDELFIDALNNEVPQIVLMGAGYDTRAYRFAKLNKSTRIIELDVAPTQSRKKKCLKKAGLDTTDGLSLVPINFDRESLQTVLERAGYDPGQKTLFLWEGVTYYLESESVDATLEFVSRHSTGDSVLAFDYVISISEETIDNYYGVREFARSMKKVHPNELFVFSIEEDQIETFLEERGLKAIGLFDDQAIKDKFLLDENGSPIGRVNGFFRFASASPLKAGSDS